MYNLIYQIVSHTWQSGTGSNATEQQIYVYMSCFLIAIVFVVIVDLLYRTFRGFISRG